MEKILALLEKYGNSISLKKFFKKASSYFIFVLLSITVVLLQVYYTDVELAENLSLEFTYGILLLTFSLAIVRILNSIVSIRTLLKIFLLFIYFGIASFFLQGAINLNNSNFSLNIYKSIFTYPNSYLLLLVIYILLSIVVKTISELKNVSSLQKKWISENQAIIIVLLPIFSLNNQLISTIVNFINVSLLSTDASRLGNILIGTIITIFLSYNLLILVDSQSNKWSGLSVAILSSVLLATCYNYFIQSGVRLSSNSNVTISEFMFTGAIEFQTFVLFILILLVYLLINRYILGTVLNVIIWSIITFANISKFQQRNEPLLLTDFIWLKKISFLLKFVEPNVLLIGLFLIIGILFLYRRYLKTIDSINLISNLKFRLFTAFSLVVLPLTLISISINDTSEGQYFSDLRNHNEYNWLGFSVNSRFKSVIYLWAQQYFSPIMEKPANYSETKIEEIVNKYVSLSDEYNQIRVNNISDQTIIYVLSESFINPERLSSLSVSKPIIPNISEIITTNTGGTMKSDGYGGGTANMEFQSLTGLPFYIFSDSISVANTEVFPKLKYIPILSNEFKSENRIVIHPDSATNYNRKNVYDALEFSKFIAKKDSKDIFANDDIVGLYPSDRLVYQTLIEELSESENQFFSIITMQNHAPYSANDPIDIVVKGIGFTDEENNSVTNYSRLLNYTDGFTKSFLDYLSQINKKITVVFYGDHLPGIFPESTFSANPETQFETDFFIWSNFETIKRDYSLINSSDLTAALLDHTNSKVSPYYALLTKVAQVDIDYKRRGQFSDVEFLKDLEILQYDLTEGEGYILKYPEFFEFD